MIEAVSAENGSRVLRYEGRLLSSAVDPQCEARGWLSRRQGLLSRVKTVFVLGAGSGYHIAELVAQTSSSIVVVEYSAELIEAVDDIHGFSSKRVRLECVQTAKALRASAQVRANVAESFLVLQHGPSMALQSAFYQDCKNQLVGRDWGSLTWQWQLKGLAPLDAQPKIHGGDEALSIYDLDNTELVQNSEERERMLFKALRELVK